MGDPTTTLGKVLRDERQRHGHTLSEVGAAAGVGRSHVCDIEHGRRLPSYEVCVAMLRFLGLSESESMRGFIVDPTVVDWACSRPGLARLLGTLAHFDVSDADLDELAQHIAREASR